MKRARDADRKEKDAMRKRLERAVKKAKADDQQKGMEKKQQDADRKEKEAMRKRLERAGTSESKQKSEVSLANNHDKLIANFRIQAEIRGFTGK